MSPFYLWVDAICINQLDHREKSIQVVAMKKTYQDALQVIVWLGDRAESRKATRRAARFLEEFLPPLPDGGTLPVDPEEFRDVLRDSRVMDIMYIIGQNVLRRPWWWRMWVIQEVAVARSIVILCDGYRFSWDHLVLLSQWLSYLRADVMNATEQDMAEGNHYLPNIRFKHGYRYNLVFAADGGNEMPILDLLQNASSCQATDNRDMIYSILGLATDMTSTTARTDGQVPDATKNENSVVIDYSRREQEVYMDFAKVHIRTHEKNPLDVITFSRYDPQRMTGLPSWVPDWSNLRRSSCSSLINPAVASPEKEAINPFYRYCASAGLLPSFSIPADNTLCMSAIRFDHIAQVGVPYLESGPPDWKFRDTIRQWQVLALGEESSIRESDSYQGGESTLLSVFDRTLSADTHVLGGRATPGRGYVFWERSLLGFSLSDPILANVMGPTSEVVQQWATQQLSDAKRAVQLRIHRRRFFISSRGFFGLAPQNAEVGDEVFILPGCSVPVVLRRDGEIWTFIGETFVAGIMDGEAVQAIDENRSDGDKEGKGSLLQGEEMDIVIR